MPEIRLMNARIIRYALGGLPLYVHMLWAGGVLHRSLPTRQIGSLFTDPGRIKSKLNVFSLLYMSLMCVVLLALDVQ